MSLSQLTVRSQKPVACVNEVLKSNVRKMFVWTWHSKNSTPQKTPYTKFHLLFFLMVSDHSYVRPSVRPKFHATTLTVAKQNNLQHHMGPGGSLNSPDLCYNWIKPILSFRKMLFKIIFIFWTCSLMHGDSRSVHEQDQINLQGEIQTNQDILEVREPRLNGRPFITYTKTTTTTLTQMVTTFP